MCNLNIRSVARKRKMHKKLEEVNTYLQYLNLLNRDFVATRPNQKWVTEITYIDTLQGWCYLSTTRIFMMGLAWLMSWP